jgi:hypothetical protein
MLERLDDCFLDEIRGVCYVPRPSRQASGCPPAEHGDMALEQQIQRLVIAGARAVEQIARELRRIASFRPVLVHCRGRARS